MTSAGFAIDETRRRPLHRGRGAARPARVRAPRRAAATGGAPNRGGGGFALGKEDEDEEASQ
jgi:hypothetical protein